MDSKKNVIIPLSREYELAYLVECEGIRYYIGEKGKSKRLLLLIRIKRVVGAVLAVKLHTCAVV